MVLFGVNQLFHYFDSDLHKIKVPTLVIGATHDTMDPEHMKWVSTQVQQGEFLLCPNGSHCSFYDDQKIYFNGLTKFIKDVDQGTFTTLLLLPIKKKIKKKNYFFLILCPELI